MRVVKKCWRLTPTGTVRIAIAYYHADWDAHFVRFFLDGVCLHKATYPADDRQDAIATADFWVNKGE